MAYPRSLPEEFKIVDATAGCVTTNGGVASDWVSLKHAHKAWVVLQFTQAVGHATQVALQQAQDVGGTGAKALARNAKAWANEDTGASDALVRQADGVSYTVAGDVKKKQVVFEVDPALLDMAGGFDCLGFTVANSAQASNLVAGQFFLLGRYQQAAPPSAVVD
ncbi:MAG: hypothetical protein GXY76_20785 [Chloroflexi bacterium]|nr:hypothetical protein [Chloroflexota bacterium]